jgi:hypothetical protein
VEQSVKCHGIGTKSQNTVDIRGFGLYDRVYRAIRTHNPDWFSIYFYSRGAHIISKVVDVLEDSRGYRKGRRAEEVPVPAGIVWAYSEELYDCHLVLDGVLLMMENVLVGIFQVPAFCFL